MKQRLQEWLLAMVFGLGIPGLILAVAAKGIPSAQPQETTAPATVTGLQAELPPSVDSTLQIGLITGEGRIHLTMEEYLVGVLLKELPEDFHMEAMKAQAVAARTYALRWAELELKHPAGYICAEHTCCQAYISPEEYLASFGSQAAVDRARQAVRETSGQVLRYQGQLIDATYFAGSGGHTEDALAVWGSDVPYLQAVESPGEEQSSHYTETVQFTSREFYRALGLELTGSPAAWLGETTYTRGGGVATMVIGGRSFTGSQLRSALNLRSTAFSLNAVGDTVTITTRGFGHRVGMSQQGAQAMALSGSDYREILTYYYTDVQITTQGS